MFFADPVAAFANIARVAATGRRGSGLLAWRELAANEWLCALRTALAAGRDLPTPPPGLPGPFGLADADHVPRRPVARRLRRRRRSMRSTRRCGSAPMSTTRYAFVSTLGITRGLLHDLEPDAATAAVEALRRTLAEHAGADGVTFDGAAWLITARAPRGES